MLNSEAEDEWLACGDWEEAVTAFGTETWLLGLLEFSVLLEVLCINFGQFSTPVTQFISPS